MKECLHLFTDVKDSLPEANTQVTFRFIFPETPKEYLISGTFHNGEFGDYVEDASCEIYEIEHATHWLDLSKLTTKEKAIEALEDLENNERFSTMPSADVVITEKGKEIFKSSL